MLDPNFKRECDAVAAYGIDVRKIYLLLNVPILFATHRALDKASELAKAKEKISSTLKGIDPTYMDKTGRNAIRAGDLLDKNFTTKLY